jgi:acyl carrier protein
MDDTYRAIVEVLVGTAGVAADAVTPQALLADLGLDSLATLEVGLALQKDLGTEIDDGDVAAARTVQDLVDVVRRAQLPTSA